MSSVKATWKNGQVVLEGQTDWAEGSRLIVREEEVPVISFMTEEEQGDDPAAIVRWIDELRAIPAVPESPEAEVERLAWEEKMRSYNLDAVRRQFEEEGR